MAITSNPTTITSAAKNGSLKAQTETGSGGGPAIPANEIIFDTDIATNNGNLTATPAATFVGRLVIIRRGQASEEVAYITQVTTAPGGGTRRCTVHQDWTVPPASGDAYDISYLTWDADDAVGNDFKVLLKRETDWAHNRRFVVGNGSNFAFFALLDGHSMESVDNSSTTVADIRVDNSGRMDVGYLAGTTPVGGGYIVGTPALVGEFVLNVVAGSKCNLHDYFMSCVKLNKAQFNGTVIWTKAKIYKATHSFDLTGDVSIFKNSTIEGTLQTTETIKCDSSTNIQSCALVSTHGLSGIDNTTTHTITLTNLEFVRNNYNIHVNGKKTWKMVNPGWVINTGTQNQLRFVVDDANAVQEFYQFDSTVTRADGTVLSGANVYVYEGLLTNTIRNSGQTDSLGEFSSDIFYKQYTSGGGGTNLTVTQYGDFAIKIYYYRRTPFVTTATFNEALSQPVALITDVAVTETSQSTAISNGNGIVVEKHGPGGTVSDPNPLKVIRFDGGNGTAPTAGAVVVGQTSNATGTVIEVLGDATEGTVVFESWNGFEFSNNENLIVTDWTGIADTTGTAESFNAEYSWLVDCSGLSMSVTYDYLAARMAEWPLQDIFESGIIWGEDEQTQFVYSTANGYTTERNVTNQEGVWVAKRGAGTVAYMTADEGEQFIPPVQYTFQLTGLKSGSEVKLFNASTQVLIDGVENSSTTYSYNYIYGGDITAYVIIHHLDYVWIRLDNLTLSNSNQSIPIQQRLDRNYANP